MDEEQFASFLKSVSKERQKEILRDTMRFIYQFYSDFKKEVGKYIEGGPDEFTVISRSNTERVLIDVKNTTLTFQANMEGNMISVLYQNTKREDDLYIKNGEVVSQKYGETISKRLLEKYLDLFKSML